MDVGTVNNNQRKPLWWQVVLQAILPATIILLLAWGVDKVATMDKTLAVVAHAVGDMSAKLEEHHVATKEILIRNSDLHHNRGMKTPCNGCHGGGRGR